jgi:hypothetical protein
MSDSHERDDETGRKGQDWRCRKCGRPRDASLRCFGCLRPAAVCACVPLRVLEAR